MVQRPGHTRDPGDIDAVVSVPARRRTDPPVLAAVAVGGGIGAVARYGAAVAWPTTPGAFPATTMLVNVIGCALIGVLMVSVTETRRVHRLTRPFLGTGVLGGFTTFSTWALDLHDLATDDRVRTAVTYLLATIATCLAAVATAAWATRRLINALRADIVDSASGRRR